VLSTTSASQVGSAHAIVRRERRQHPHARAAAGTDARSSACVGRVLVGPGDDHLHVGAGGAQDADHGRPRGAGP
jgi:hypothetical protein